ncbi:nicotinamide-nucleotide amidohydrolase family protein [Nostocoides sp. F2B08]|uniref:CinA family protein n=1 Tax=Nostocoides sp. F2B08 TaxID=2653936 RepID=UPI00126390D1|nr:CinA family protein [Tetrasphaera sp. F2B08]KAB7744787.1 nicotinamide-nucleotide amidohydrolase family protein [Tetrasphaera sp. F2B08]
MHVSPAPERLAVDVIHTCRQRGLTLATAESLTGGLVCGALTSVPGSSLVVRGGVVAYATDRKSTLLGVSADLLAERGAVDADVASAMAEGVRGVMVADVGLATTGVAGPDPQDGHEVGTVFVAVSAPGVAFVERLALDGDRATVREATVDAALGLCLEALSRLVD